MKFGGGGKVRGTKGSPEGGGEGVGFGEEKIAGNILISEIDTRVFNARKIALFSSCIVVKPASVEFLYARGK